jgi:predicted GNAT family N-acyltransferase
MAELAFDQLPESARQRLPRYPIPAMRIGRLAVSLSHRGMGFGEKLLVDALNLALRLQNDVGLYAVIVDAKDETATRFYEYFGFIRLHEQERLLFLPIATIAMT